jgi:hypothetical protein
MNMEQMVFVVGMFRCSRALSLTKTGRLNEYMSGIKDWLAE